MRSRTVVRDTDSGGGEVRRAEGDWGEAGAREWARVSEAGGGEGERSLEGGRSRSGDLRVSLTAVFVWDMVGMERREGGGGRRDGRAGLEDDGRIRNYQINRGRTPPVAFAVAVSNILYSARRQSRAHSPRPPVPHLCYPRHLAPLGSRSASPTRISLESPPSPHTQPCRRTISSLPASDHVLLLLLFCRSAGQGLDHRGLGEGDVVGELEGEGLRVDDGRA